VKIGAKIRESIRAFGGLGVSTMQPFGSLSLFGKLPQYMVLDARGKRSFFPSLETAENYQKFLEWKGNAPNDIKRVSLLEGNQNLDWRKISIFFRVIFSILFLSGILFFAGPFQDIETDLGNAYLNVTLLSAACWMRAFVDLGHASLLIWFLLTVFFWVSLYLALRVFRVGVCRFVVFDSQGIAYSFRQEAEASYFKNLLVKQKNFGAIQKTGFLKWNFVGLLFAAFYITVFLGFGYWAHRLSLIFG
jgi:hypothetical protein